jgi:hypothetical protein
MELTERERELLAFERSWFLLDEPKDVALATRFELSPARYDELLIELIERPEALEHDPLVVRRLQRERARRRANRLGDHPSVTERGH